MEQMEDELYGGLIAIRIARPDLRVNLFTESELAAAELLVQLSESANSCREYHRDQSPSSSTTSSPRSVNTPLKLNPMAMGGDDDDHDVDVEDEMAAAVLPTRKKRYRMLTDVYESMACIAGGSEEKQNDGKRRKKRKWNGNGNVGIAL